MDFRLTPEQTGFAQSLSELMTRADPVAAARSWAAGDHEPGLALWHRLSEQGVSALVVPGDDGGLGGTAVDLVVAFEVLGHQLAVGPWIESAAFLATALDGDDLAAVAAGSIATVAVPPLVPWALDADVAEKVYLSVDGGLETLAGARSSTTVRQSVDKTRRLSVVEEGAEPLGGRATSGALRRAASVSERTRDGRARPGGRETETSDQSRRLRARLADALELAFLACAAELLGCGERLLADTVVYAKQRKQYGRQIGSYQAIKHQLADVRIALDFAHPLVHGAALTVATGSPTASRDVSAAKVAAGDAAYLASRVALQVHGAIGYTAELDLGLWINRVRALVGAWGGPAYHRSRIAESL